MKQPSVQSRESRASKRRTFRFERIETWQVARTFNRSVYAASRKFPKEEMFALTSQIRRASVSVSSNIAEGSGRNSDTDFAHFLEIAYGSLMEVVSQLFIAIDESYIGQPEFDALANDADLLASKIVALSKSLGRSARIAQLSPLGPPPPPHLPSPISPFHISHFAFRISHFAFHISLFS